MTLLTFFNQIFNGYISIMQSQEQNLLLQFITSFKKQKKICKNS
jgi:hypothetical protein